MKEHDAGRDYPESIVSVGHREPVPGRMRGVLNGVAVRDTTRAVDVWECAKDTHSYVANERDGNLIVPERSATSLLRRIAGEDNGQVWRVDA
ncbi:MAG TPA: hypothetical protein VH063_16010 [Gaiellaceae bacterium]|nr:hypothetical protein [Gaiellaceae bacterium]